MKKIISMMLATIMVFSLTACGNDKNTDTESMRDTTALTVLETVWGSYEEADKFPIMGGDMANVVDNEPGAFNVDDTESMDASLHVFAELAAKIDNAASMIHMMNANTFTAAAYVLTEGTNVEEFMSDLKDSIVATQWMCGFPEVLYIAKVSDTHVVAVFGAADLIDAFEAKLTAAYESTEVYYKDVAEAL